VQYVLFFAGDIFVGGGLLDKTAAPSSRVNVGWYAQRDQFAPAGVVLLPDPLFAAIGTDLGFVAMLDVEKSSNSPRSTSASFDLFAGATFLRGVGGDTGGDFAAGALGIGLLVSAAGVGLLAPRGDSDDVVATGMSPKSRSMLSSAFCRLSSAFAIDPPSSPPNSKSSALTGAPQASSLTFGFSVTGPPDNAALQSTIKLQLTTLYAEFRFGW
jgi:hypothetical protein